MGLAIIVAVMSSQILGFKGHLWTTYIALTITLASMPDIDLRLGLPHRKYTHNLLFISILALLLGYVTLISLDNYYVGFFSALISGISHLLGDLMTYMGFTPLYPLSDRVLSLRLFKSNNKLVNNLLLVTGVVSLTLYYLIYGP